MRPLLFILTLIVEQAALFTGAAIPLDLKGLGDDLKVSQNYSWVATVLEPNRAEARPLSVEGKIGENGLTALTLRFGDRTIHGYIKGNQTFLTSPDTKWRDVPEMEKGEHPARFMHRLIMGITPPARQIAEITQNLRNAREQGDVYTGELDETQAAGLLTRGESRRDFTQPSEASGSAKFWVENGRVNKYQFTVRRKINREGKEMESERTTVVEIKDIGNTVIELPQDAKDKLGIE